VSRFADGMPTAGGGLLACMVPLPKKVVVPGFEWSDSEEKDDQEQSELSSVTAL
jgi:hypothetical protein